MGNNWSSMEEESSPDPWWPTAQPQPGSTQSARNEEVADTPSRGRVKEEELETFKQELARKRALRHVALAALQSELRDLRFRVEEEKKLRQTAEEERDKLRTCTGEEFQRELEKEREEKKKLLEERERLMEEVDEKAGLERQVQALKDVSQIGKEMLRIRELQVKELKKKLVEINISSVVAPPEDLRIEYEKQIENIRKLRTLYEERAAATLLEHRRELEREEAKIAVVEAKLSDIQKEVEDYREVKKELEVKIEKLESTVQQNEDDLEKTKDALFSSSVQNRSLNSQMTLINNLFSQMLISPDVDLDRLTRLLKGHHGLITDLTMNGDSNEVAPLLVDLAEQIETEQESDKEEEQSTDENGQLKNKLQSEIASNLSKVWRVMVELLSHHQTPTQTEPAGGAENCYKSVQTPAGPRSVISVSQTFLTLKDLILEKNKLVKEVGRLKTLNNHLEHRLGNQEKRLSVVTTELRKTWSVVNKLKAQHKQLHTHEKILRYELQQKRCMLTELKGELEHCREKWEKARQKNSQTEEDWKKLRKEFAARKSRKESNSAESGYEEDDVQSPPSEPIKYARNHFELSANEVSEPELSEEDIEHSDGNSFDTVIDLLDIACLDNQQDNQSEVPFLLCEVSPQPLEIPPNLLPLTGSDLTEGLDQIESEDLAAVLDVQYQTQLLGADYNLSLPSSSGSSPIPTENDDFTSSEVDISEEDVSSNDNHIYSSPLPHINQPVAEDVLLFGSNSSTNISRFLDGLFVDVESINTSTNQSSNLTLNIPTNSNIEDESDCATLSINGEHVCHCSSDLTPLVGEDNCYIFPDTHGTIRKGITDTEDILETGSTLQIGVPTRSQIQESTENQGVIGEQSINQAIETACEPVSRTQEGLLKAREDRLKRLEHQCRSLVNKVTSTSFRSELISSKLDELHLAYGSSEPGVCEEAGLKEKATGQESDITQCEISMHSGASSSKTSAGQEEEGNGLSFNYTNQNEIVCPNVSTTTQKNLETRTERLNRLEDQCKSLFSKMSATSSRSDSLSNKLDELHEYYGPSEQTTAIPIQPTDFNIHFPTSKHLTDGKITGMCQVNENKTVNVSQVENTESKPPDLAIESKEILNQCSPPGPSLEPAKSVNANTNKDRTPEEILEARAERFKRLEDQCKSLLSKMTATSLRSEIISNKLDELHSCYGSSEDASDNEENSLLSKGGDKRTTSSSSCRYSKKSASLAESGKQTQSITAQNINTISSETYEEIEAGPQDADAVIRNRTVDDNDGNTVVLSRINEETVQMEEQRCDKPEEGCECLLSKIASPAILTNQQTELHKQHCQSSTSQPTSTSHINPEVIRVDQNSDDGSESITNTIKLQAETKQSDSTNKTSD